MWTHETQETWGDKMKVSQYRWTEDEGWNPALEAGDVDAPDVAFVFGARPVLQGGEQLNAIRNRFSNAIVLGGSTSGEIIDEEVLDDSLVVSAIKFEKTDLKLHSVTCSEGGASLEAGKELGQKFATEGLRHVFVISNGLNVNGTDLTAGLTEVLPDGVTITGGLTGDAADFGETFVVAGDAGTTTMVAGLGLYGDSLKVGFGSAGGWDVFGPERKVTKSSGGVLNELDGKSALSLYKEYLGEHAEQLPGSALLFPIMVTREGSDRGVVRTILSVDETEHTMTFAGDVAEGAKAQLMKANTDRLVDGAASAAKACVRGLDGESAQFTVLVSCVGRKLVMKQRVEEEVEAVREVIGDASAMTGFYSYGELAPYEAGSPCELHNQTMTITAFSEV